MLAPRAFGFYQRIAGGGEGQDFRACNGVTQEGDGVGSGRRQGRLQDAQAQRRSFLNPDAMLRQHGHVQFEQEFEILDDSGWPLGRNHAIEAVASNIRSLVKTFVEELHERRTLERQDGRARFTCL